MPLTPNDLQAIQDLVESAIESKLEPIKMFLANVPSRAELEIVIEQKLEPIKEQIRNIPTKEEYFNSMDALVGEVREYRIERVTLATQVERVEQRLDHIETKLELNTNPQTD